MLELKDTVDLMLSDNYRDRFRAEYWQLRIRKEKLEKLIDDYNNGRLMIQLSCDIDIHRIQLRRMKKYLAILENRAKIEEIEL